MSCKRDYLSGNRKSIPSVASAIFITRSAGGHPPQNSGESAIVVTAMLPSSIFFLTAPNIPLNIFVRHKRLQAVVRVIAKEVVEIDIHNPWGLL